MFKFEGNTTYYPTPPEVIEQLIDFNVQDKTILEPSAGAGRIVEYIKESGGIPIACEIDNELHEILKGKCKIVGRDFLQLKSEDISHIHAIVMNPPFNKAAAHILHAWKIAPAGCLIRALCNLETLKSSYTHYDEVRQIIKENGQYEDIGAAFSIAERDTAITEN